MSVASHLDIQVDEYDARIRTFVPNYEQLINTAAETLCLLQTNSPTIVDLGVGTGALAVRCLEVCPNAALIGIDADPAMLQLAYARIGQHPRARLELGNFVEMALPECDAFVACISLHHVQYADAKLALYRACRSVLRPGGLLVSADSFPARKPELAAAQQRLWLQHLEQFYSPTEARDHLIAWAHEDTYYPLEDELEWLRAAGFQSEVVWRSGEFAVVVGFCT